jgi:hypothetical protein
MYRQFVVHEKEITGSKRKRLILGQMFALETKNKHRAKNIKVAVDYSTVGSTQLRLGKPDNSSTIHNVSTTTSNN